MILLYKDLRLRSIQRSDLELLRKWRNDEKIKQHMFFQDYITPEMQKIWFQNLKEKELYFIIEYRNEEQGLVHLKQLDYIERTAEVGLFIYNEKYWGTVLPVYASFTILRYAFENINLNSLIAKVKEYNTTAKNYNKSLGFIDVDTNTQKLTKERYEEIVKPKIKI